MKLPEPLKEVKEVSISYMDRVALEKIFIWRVLCACLRSKGEIVLPLASSDIATLILPKGRTAHSRFGIPIM